MIELSPCCFLLLIRKMLILKLGDLLGSAASRNARRISYSRSSMDRDLQISQLLPDEYEVDVASLDQAASERPFLRASFELLKEAAVLTALPAELSIRDLPQGVDRNNAILCGHLVRMTKLMRTIIRAVVDDHGGDQLLSVARQFLDSASTVVYLLGDDGSTSRFDAY